ncbi:MAG: DUF4476 domain-containing protein [Flavobacteriia bacterium]|nr:DUF4476 domain-containing protein [Flavobacteriia bacterium]
MKLAICFCIISSCIFGQSNFTVFNNNGQAFYVILNGVKQNSLPQTNVVVSGLVNSAYSVKLIFSDGKTADIDKNFFIDSPSDITTRIVFKKGKGKLQLISQIPTVGASTGETVINYRPDNNASFSDGSVGIGFVGNSTTTTVVTETTTQQSGNGSVNIQAIPTPTPSNSSNGNVGINVNVNGQTTGGNVNITNTATPANGSAGIQMNIVDSTSGQNMGVNMSININGQVIDPNAQINTNVVVPANVTISGNAPANTNSSTVITTTTTTTTNSSNSSNNVVTNTSSPTNFNVNCSKTLNNTAVFIEELKGQSFEDDRVEALQLALVNMCLYAADAEKIMPLFTFDANQLTVAKFMSDRLVDKENASSLAKHFSFDSTKMEYRKYISGKN